MGTYSDVALYVYPAQADEEVTNAYKAWMVINKARIVDLIIGAGLEVSKDFEVDIFAHSGLKWYGSHVDALMTVLGDELIDIPFLSWELISVSEEDHREYLFSNKSSYHLGTRITFTIDGEDA
jgi:hypothetical protein